MKGFFRAKHRWRNSWMLSSYGFDPVPRDAITPDASGTKPREMPQPYGQGMTSFGHLKAPN